MTTLPAIPSQYAGVQFRSRLEARVAVLLDHLNIVWEYEFEPVHVPQMDTIYLPDFWLPDLRCYIEVKGHVDAWRRDEKLLYWAAECDSGLENMWESGGRNDGPVKDPLRMGGLLLIGGIPRPRNLERADTYGKCPVFPMYLHRKGPVAAAGWFDYDDKAQQWFVARAEINVPADNMTGDDDLDAPAFLAGRCIHREATYSSPGYKTMNIFNQACAAARSAKFDKNGRRTQWGL